ncbi:MAG: S1C family serine protease [Candidatus Flexifilum sp.]
MKRLVSLFVLTAALAAASCQPGRGPAPTPVVSATRISDLTLRIDSIPTPVPDALIDVADADYLLLQNIYERVAPSVVNIEVVTRETRFGLGGVSRGSGFIYSTEGHIVTNAHVVDSASEIRITFNDGFVTDAEVLGTDTYSDLAVLRVSLRDPARLRPIVFGDSRGVRVGQRAIAIGNPFGLNSSMSVGIVSALGRQLPSVDATGTRLTGFQNPSIIQVDAPINPGNSGGPLLNSRGELIGVNTAIRSESGVFEGVAFAVPSATVARVVPELIENGRVEYAWLGISSLSADDGFGLGALAEPLNLPVTQGVLVDTVYPNSPAAAAGLQGGRRLTLVRGREVCTGGDIIIAINGEPVRTMDDIVAYLVTNSRPGDVVELLVLRGDQTLEIPVTLEARPTGDQALLRETCGQ